VPNSLQQLTNDVASYINRQDVVPVMPAFVRAVELELTQTLRARCQLTEVTQPIDAAYITMPPDFATMASIRDARTGENLLLKDEWSGSWTKPYRPVGSFGGAYWDTIPDAPCSAYRLVGNCVEFLPHPVFTDPLPPNYVFQTVLMVYFAKPTPLLLPGDTNPILEELYPVYLYGCLKQAAIWALDDNRAQQMDALWQQQITRADLHKQQSDLSGAPLRAELVAF
jgi:hypothetical protein